MTHKVMLTPSRLTTATSSQAIKDEAISMPLSGGVSSVIGIPTYSRRMLQIAVGMSTSTCTSTSGNRWATLAAARGWPTIVISATWRPNEALAA